MSDVSLIGLGAMGMALARTLLDAGRQITIWQRLRCRAAGAACGPRMAASYGDEKAPALIKVLRARTQ